MRPEFRGTEKGSRRWLVPMLVATSTLIIIAVGAYFVFGRELFQRPFLAIAAVVAWFGVLVGMSIGSNPSGL